MADTDSFWPNGVRLARKDEIADWALKARADTPVYGPGAPSVSGLPGSAA